MAAMSSTGQTTACAGFRPWYRSGGELSGPTPDDEVAAYLFRLHRRMIENMERETGIEPATSSLGSWRSTAELLPLTENDRADISS